MTNLPDKNIYTYVRSENNKKIIIMNGDRRSFRCRQRNKTSNGKKVSSLKFVSFKVMERENKKYNKGIIGPVNFNTLSRL